MSINELQGAVAALVTRDNFRAARPAVFPSEGSLEWFIREQKDALIAAGAIVLLRQRWLIDPVAFDSCLLKIGAAHAAKKVSA